MVTMTLKEDFDASSLETGGLCLGYKKIKLLFNIGPYPKDLSANCLIIEANGKVTSIDSLSLIHDLEAYELSRE